jgi:acetyl esterase/lipase
VLFWAYGGTLVSGERNLPASQGLLYANVGAWFAQKGFVVVIPEVRLAPAVHWPAQAEDVRDAMVWVVQHAAELHTAGVTLDVENLVAMGHSAGAVNVATVFFLPELLAGTDIERRFKALVMHAGQFAFEVEGAQTLVPAPVLAQYFGTPEQVFEREPLTLFRKLTDEQIRELPEMLIVEAEKEPAAFWRSGEMFRKSLDEGENRVHGKKVGWIKAAGHNHVSPNWVLGTGEGEEWAEEVAAWIKGAFKGEHANW